MWPLQCTPEPPTHVAGQERAEPPHRQRFLRRIVADRQRVARRVHHQVVAHHVAQLVADVRHRVVVGGGAHGAALERDHLETGFGQLLGQDAAGPTETDDDDIDFLQLRDHGVLLQLMSAMLSGLVRKRLVAILCDVLAVDRDHAREADHLPACLVAVAAVDRVGEHALHHGLIDRGPEHPRRQPALEGELAGRQPHQHLLALLLIEPVERLAVGLAAMGIGGRDAGAIELRRRERQLVALARHAGLPWSLHVEAIALAPGARKRAVDIDVDAEVGALRRELIGGHHVIDQRLDERRLLQIQEGITGGRGSRGGLLRLRGRGQIQAAGRSRGGAAHHGTFDKIASAEPLIFRLILHAILPGLRRSFQAAIPPAKMRHCGRAGKSSRERSRACRFEALPR